MNRGTTWGKTVKTALAVFVVLATSVFSIQAYAACATPAGVAGEMVYNADNNIMQFCDGTNWIGMAGSTGSGGAGVTDGNKGDLTVSGSGATWTINAASVQYSKIQNVTSGSILGRYTAGSGSVQELTIGSGLSLNTSTGVLTAAGTGSSGTAGYIQFSGGSGAFLSSSTTSGQQFFWDETNHRLGIGLVAPTQALDVVGTVTSDQVLLKSVTGAAAPTGNGGSGSYTPQLMVVRDEESDGTTGGSSISGTQTRVLNTVQYNNISGASLASNVVTLPAGTYHIVASAPAYQTGGHQIRLYNVTGSSALVYGTAEYSGTADAGANRSVIDAVLTFGASTQIRLEHNTVLAVSSNGLGPRNANTFGVEVYATMSVEKLQ